jgi:Fe(3+) dicitrate transport protein
MYQNGYYCYTYNQFAAYYSMQLRSASHLLLRVTLMKTVLTIITFAACTAYSSGLFAQEYGTISGKVTDAETGEPLAGANIDIEGTTTGAATTETGMFEILDLPLDSYTVICSYIGYQHEERTITLDANSVVNVHFELTANLIESPEIVVSREMLLGGTGMITGIPGSAHYIDNAELEKHNNTDIHRILMSIPGITIQEEDGYGLRPNIGMRGTGVERSQKINLMEDGVLIAPAPYSAPAAYYFPTVGRMESIEIRKGSSQIKYGPYTTGGALNLLSTRIPVQLKGKLNVNRGGHDQRETHASIGNAFSNFGFLAETYHISANGFKNLDNGGPTGFNKEDYLVKLRFNTNRTAPLYQSLTVKLSKTDEVSNETYLGLAQNDFAIDPFRRYAGSQVDVLNTDHKQATATHFLMLDEKFDITTTLYRNEFSRNWYKLDRVRAGTDGARIKIKDLLDDLASFEQEYSIISGTSSVNDNALEVKANNRSYFSTGIQSIIGFQAGSIGTALHQIELGIRYHEDEIDRFQWVDSYRMNSGIMEIANSGIPGTESNRIGSAKTFAYFAQYKFRKGKFSTLPGMRYETMRLKQFDYGKSDPGRLGNDLKLRGNAVSIWIPGIGIEYEFNENLQTFAGIHKGFSPPGPKEGTDPETSINYEFGTRWSSDFADTQLTLFFNDYDNLLGSDLAGTGGSSTGDLFNGGKVEIKGLEYSANFDLSKIVPVQQYSLPITAMYTFTDGVFKNTFESEYDPWGDVSIGDEIPYLSRHQFSIVSGIAAAAWNFDISGKYSGTVRTVAGQGDFTGSQRVNSRFIVDANAEHRLMNNTLLIVSVKNLLDTTYIAARRPAGIRPGLPRTVIIGVKTGI